MEKNLKEYLEKELQDILEGNAARIDWVREKKKEIDQLQRDIRDILEFTKEQDLLAAAILSQLDEDESEKETVEKIVAEVAACDHFPDGLLLVVRRPCSIKRSRNSRRNMRMRKASR